MRMGPGGANSARARDDLTIQASVGWTITRHFAYAVVRPGFVFTVTGQDKDSFCCHTRDSGVCFARVSS